MAQTATRRPAVRDAYRGALDRRQRSGLWSWVGFTTTFGAVRAITYAIHDGKGPFRNIRVGGAHLHHYLWGIAAVSGVAVAAVRGDDDRRGHPALSLTYGAGMALIVDEFALLLDLEDVYWAKQGRVSVDLGIGAVAVGGLALSAGPVLRRLRRVRRRPAAQEVGNGWRPAARATSMDAGSSTWPSTR